MLKGDAAIFERLIEKVEEINRSTRSGESQLKLYDSEKEAQYFAEKGLLAGDKDVLDHSMANSTEANDLEMTISAGNLKANDDLLALLGIGGSEDSAVEEPEQVALPIHSESANPLNRIRFYQDMDFLKEAYDLLKESNRDYQPLDDSGPMVTITAPADLKRRLGEESTQKGGVIFGATAIPTEAWPKYDQFRLTADVERVKLAIEAARNTSGYWSQEMLCSETHPIMQWLVERLLMEYEQGEAPIITSKHLPEKELAFCFIGQVPSKVGTPLVVNAHAVRIRPGGSSQIMALAEMLAEAGFKELANVDRPAQTTAGQLLLSAAVEVSLDYLKGLEETRQKSMMPLLRQEERRLKQWKRKRRELIAERISGLDPDSRTVKRLQQEREDMEKYIQSRQAEWRDMHLLPGESPITRLVLVIEGVS